MTDTRGSIIRVMVVDDHEVFRDGVASMIETQKDMELVAAATKGLEAIDLFRIHRPDITLMDLRLPDISGLDAIVRIRESNPTAKTIVLTTYRGDVRVIKALRAGASAYLLKSVLRLYMLDTIRAVYAGQRRIPPEIATDMAEYAADDSLTPREVEVLQQASMGNANKIIADTLAISEDTVKSHMKSILSKLGAKDRTHAVTIGMRRGFLDPVEL